MGSWQQQGEAARETLFEIAASQLVFALGCPASATADQFGEIAVAVAIGGEQDKADLVVRGSWFVARNP